MYEALLIEIGTVVIFASLLAATAKLVRQPLIPAYILAGILIGPSTFSLISDRELIFSLSQLGIAFLLFTTGLELDVSRIKRQGKVVTFVGIFQIILTAGLAYFLALFLNFSPSTALYLGFLLSLSSTMVVVKFMQDKRQLSTLHGRIILGILLLQDIVAVALLSVSSAGLVSLEQLLKPLLTSLGFVSLAFVTGKYLAPPLLRKIARDTELLFLVSLSFLFLFSFFSVILNLPVSIGAFLAGIAIASFPYNIEISSKISSLRDFFAVIFFVSLGMEFNLHVFLNYLDEILILSLFVVLLKPAIIYVLMSIWQHERKTSFFTGIYLAQVSEFSLILSIQSFNAGLLSEEIFGIIISITLLTMCVTPYFILYAFNIFYRIDSFLCKFDRIIGFGRKHFKCEISQREEEMKDHVIICGADITGRHLVRELLKKNIPFVVIDFDPEVVERYYERGIPVIYGDVTHPEVLEAARVKLAKLVVSTVPSVDDNLFLVSHVKRNSKGRVICVSESVDDALKLYRAGADYVVLPKLLAMKRISSLIEKSLRRKKYLDKIKEANIKFLRKEMVERSLARGKEFLMDIKEKLEAGSGKEEDSEREI